MFRSALVLSLALLPCSAGCLVCYERIDTVRRDEAPSAVSFQSPAAERLFADGLERNKDRGLDVSSSRFSMPFLVSWSRVARLSEAAFFNDQIKACDRDGDGVLSDHEVLAYHKHITGKDDPLEMYRASLQQQGDVKIAGARKSYEVKFKRAFCGMPEVTLSPDAAHFARVETSEEGFRISFQEPPAPCTLHWEARGRPFVPHGTIQVKFGIPDFDDE